MAQCHAAVTACVLLHLFALQAVFIACRGSWQLLMLVRDGGGSWWCLLLSIKASVRLAYGIRIFARAAAATAAGCWLMHASACSCSGRLLLLSRLSLEDVLWFWSC